MPARDGSRPADARRGSRRHALPVRRALVLVLAVCLLPAGCTLRRRAAPLPSPYCRGGDPLAGVYHPARLHVRARCRVVSGLVEKVLFEGYDGDVHIWLRTPEERLASEIIPQDRALVGVPEPGERVTVVGPYVEDLQHGWNEIHPTWLVTPGRILPATRRDFSRVHALLGDG
jgi:hypothetical protein